MVAARGFLLLTKPRSTRKGSPSRCFVNPRSTLVGSSNRMGSSTLVGSSTMGSSNLVGSSPLSSSPRSSRVGSPTPSPPLMDSSQTKEYRKIRVNQLLVPRHPIVSVRSIKCHRSFLSIFLFFPQCLKCVDHKLQHLAPRCLK
jgi:hypothetical protein